MQFEKTQSIQGEVHDIVLDITRARKELYWQPHIDIEQGLKKTYQWFKEQNNN